MSTVMMMDAEPANHCGWKLWREEPFILCPPDEYGFALGLALLATTTQARQVLDHGPTGAQMWGSTSPCSGGWTSPFWVVSLQRQVSSPSLSWTRSCASIPAMPKWVDCSWDVGRNLVELSLWHGPMAKGQHREKATLESRWRQALPSTPGTCNTQLSPQWRFFLGGTCPIPPLFLYSLHPWLTIQLRWGRKSLNLDGLCSPWHLFLGVWLSLCWVWLPADLGLSCCLCLLSSWEPFWGEGGAGVGVEVSGEGITGSCGLSQHGDSGDTVAQGGQWSIWEGSQPVQRGQPVQRSVSTGPWFRTGGLAGLWMLPVSSVSPAEAADLSRRSWCKTESLPELLQFLDGSSVLFAFATRWWNKE